jgi:hypothetical protein
MKRSTDGRFVMHLREIGRFQARSCSNADIGIPQNITPPNEGNDLRVVWIIVVSCAIGVYPDPAAVGYVPLISVKGMGRDDCEFDIPRQEHRCKL